MKSTDQTSGEYALVNQLGSSVMDYALAMEGY
jgi:hypothetical protein